MSKKIIVGLIDFNKSKLLYIEFYSFRVEECGRRGILKLNKFLCSEHNESISILNTEITV